MVNMPQTQQFQTQTPAPVENDKIDLNALFSAIWRGKWLIAIITILAIMLGGYYAYVAATPLYRSTAVVILETEQKSVVDLQSVVGGLSGDTTEVNTEVEVLRSRGLMGKVVDRLNLLRDPEFNGNLRPASMVATVRNKIKSQLGLQKEKVLLSPEEQAKRTRDNVISALLDKITIGNVQQSLVFQITAETETPTKSALVADTIVELYIINQLDVKLEATEQATSWLSQRVAELQVELERAESAVSEFSASTDLVSLQALQILERRLKDLRERISNTADNATSAQARLGALQAAETRKKKAILAADPQLTRFLMRAETDEEMAAAFDTRFGQVITRAELEVTRARQQQIALGNSEEELQAQIASQSEDLISLQQLAREAEATRLLYEYFLTRLKETSAQQGIQKADSRILSNAVVPATAASPRKSLILALSGILGMMVGAGLVLLGEMQSNGFRTARDLEAFSGLTVLGQVPTIPVRNRKKLLRYLSDKPTSAAAESVRNLRTSVLLSNIDTPPKVIVSTSSIPGEGKTTNSLALAHNLVDLGKSVLLVEGDLRRRTINQYFSCLPDEGVVAVLSGNKTLEEAVYRPAEFGADLLVGENTSANAADLFSSGRFMDLIAEARKQYDAVIIDTPPVLMVPDARIISQIVDAVLFTVHWDKTTKQQLEEALRIFQGSSQKITGLVLSQINSKRMKQYGYGGRYGAYVNYGSKYYNN